MKIHLNNSILLKGIINIKKYRKDFLSAYLNCSIRAINNYLNGEKLSKKIFTNLIRFIDEEDINPYSLINFDDENHLYHASKEGIKGKISVSYNLNHLLDFGNGFYLSESFFTALSYVDNYPNPIIYRFNRSDILKHKKYTFNEEISGVISWVIYIGLNRRKISNRNEESFFKEYYSSLLNNYPILIGKIADSYNFKVMDQFFLNIYDAKQVSVALKSVDLGSQVVLKSQKIADSITEYDEITLDKDLLEFFRQYHKKKTLKIKRNNANILDKDKRDDSYLYSSLKEKMLDEFRK